MFIPEQRAVMQPGVTKNDHNSWATTGRSWSRCVTSPHVALVSLGTNSVYCFDFESDCIKRKLRRSGLGQCKRKFTGEEFVWSPSFGNITLLILKMFDWHRKLTHIIQHLEHNSQYILYMMHYSLMPRLSKSSSHFILDHGTTAFIYINIYIYIYLSLFA